MPDTLVEIWQANAGGRYRHRVDNWPSPLDPNFTGGGRTITDDQGYFRFVTIQPGAYPWGNHPNAWRPAHIHFSLFGRAFTQRLVTQMYFPDDPLFFQDPIYNSVRDERAARRMISAYDHDATEESLGARLPLGHRAARRGSDPDRGAARMTTPSQTVGPYLSIGLPWPDGPDVVPEGTPKAASASTAALLRRRRRADPRRHDRDLAGRPRRQVRHAASAASAAARPTTRARTRSSPSSPGGSATARPRTSTSTCSHVACSTAA